MWGSRNQLHLGPVDFDPDLGYVSYFWGIDQPITTHYLKTTSSEQHGHVKWTLSMASHLTFTPVKSNIAFF